MTRPTLLDLFCGVGGAAMGYHRAGFDVFGVDNRPQPHYPFPFRQGDALSFTDADRFDAIHASPPCKAYGATKSSTRHVGHPPLVAITRELLIDSGRPWVMENVPGAPLYDTITLCGAEFALTADDDDGTPLVLKRHRLFESDIHLTDAGGCACKEYKANGYRVAGVYGGGRAARDEYVPNTERGGYTPSVAVRRRLMGMPWAPLTEITQSIPPAYTEHIGRQLLGAL